MTKKLQPSRKIVKRDLTENQFMAVLRQVCQPLKKPRQFEPKRVEVMDEKGEGI